MALRVLIVDSDPRARRGLRALLETQSDMSVIGEADTATGAVQCAQALQPSIVLLDLMLPTLDDGLATLRRLAAHSCRCIASSWQSNLREAALGMGASDFIERGGSPERVLAALRGTDQNGSSRPLETEVSSQHLG
ncbi:MAG TPA: response regulator transcription factor [Chloroflexota bacterium]